ncbi:MAG: HAD family phosphatase [Pyrinomonadaceae bacterium]
MTDFTQRAFIFDMDGTLVDNMRFHTRAWQKMLAENGVVMDADEFLIKTAGKTNSEIIPGVFGPVSQERLKALGDRKEELYRESFLPERKAIDGAVRFLEESRRLGIKMAVATSAPDENMEFILDGLGLRRFFKAITTADDIKNGKPHPESFLTSAEKLGVSPALCLVFEDALNGFEAARRAGMRAIGITTVNPAEELLRLPSVVEARADFTELNPSEIIEKHLPDSRKAEV